MNNSLVFTLGAWILHLFNRKIPTAYFEKKYPVFCYVVGGGILTACMLFILWIEDIF